MRSHTDVTRSMWWSTKHHCDLVPEAVDELRQVGNMSLRAQGPPARLVEEEQVRLGGRAPGRAQPAFAARREGVGPAVGELGDSEALECGHRASRSAALVAV